MEKNYMGIDTTNYQNAKSKSISGKPVERKKECICIEKGFLKKSYIVLGAAAIVVGIGLSSAISKIDNKITSNSYVYYNRTIVTENTHRTSDNQNFWYDTDDIAFEISTLDESVDKDAIIYATYMNLDYNRTDNMNDVMRALKKYEDETSKFKKYNSFAEYVIDFGFVKENGEADIEEYKKYMDGYVCNLSKLEEYQSDKGGKAR